MSTRTRIRTGERAKNWSEGKIRLAFVVGFLVFAAIALFVTGHKTSPHILLDPRFGIPAPPTDKPYLVADNIGITVLMTAIGLIGVVLGLYHLMKTRSALGLMIALSSVLICVPEVFFDVMGAVYFPWSDTEPLGHAFGVIGRQMPWWILAGWFSYGSFSIVIFFVLSSKPTTRTVWLLIGGASAFDVLSEEIVLKLFHTYHYYGNQPLILISQMPWWFIPCNSVGVFLGASLAYRFGSYLSGWRSLLMLIVTPLSVATVYGAIALPSWIAVNGDYPWLVTQILGLATIALGIVVFILILELVLNRAAFDMSYAPSKDQDEFELAKGAAMS